MNPVYIGQASTSPLKATPTGQSRSPGSELPGALWDGWPGGRRIDAFELWCWRRLLRAPWTTRRSNKSLLKEINPECSLEGLMLKWKLQFFGHLMPKADSFEKTLMLGKIEDGRRRGWQRTRWLDGITDSWVCGHEFEWTLGVGDGQGGLVCCSPWGCKESDMTDWLNWTELNWTCELTSHVVNWMVKNETVLGENWLSSQIIQFIPKSVEINCLKL